MRSNTILQLNEVNSAMESALQESLYDFQNGTNPEAWAQSSLRTNIEGPEKYVQYP